MNLLFLLTYCRQFTVGINVLDPALQAPHTVAHGGGLLLDRSLAYLEDKMRPILKTETSR